ncbi:MAG: L-lysine 6-transaminase [Phycisphaerae bacterium]|nr:L-lysine 6-transaminase [Phycisphaerae bacterium]|tara:strand:+ start:2185 stop:3516 length:1332 start_codon:yes stop_codon:yes gene_type:complete
MEIGMNPNRVLEELARHQLVDGYPMVVDLERSEGVWIHDAASGNRYMDAFTCFASMPLGFNHPGMNDSGFLDTLRRAALCNVSNADIYSCEMADFVDTFATYASPEGFNHHFWIAGGGLAVENAMKAAFDWKARRLGRTDFEDNCDDLKIMHFRQAFHGRTGYTMSVTNTIPDKVGLFPKFPWPRIHNPACQFDLDGNICNDVEAEEAKACEQIEAAFGSGKNDIAGILIEPMQGEGGDNHFRPEFMAKLRAYADEGDALLLYDEVQTGFFGSGKPWFWEHQGVQPDVVSFGKKAQVCGIYAGARMDEVEHNVFRRSSRINSTWGGNLVDMVRSRRYMEIIVEDNLCDHVLTLGEHVISGMRRIAASTGAFSNIRGIGSLIACTFDTAEARDSLVRNLFEHKVITLPCGDRSMRFRLPLIMTIEEADHLLNAVESAASSTATV